MDFDSLKSKVKTSIAKGRTGQAIELLRDYIIDKRKDLASDILNLSSMYFKAEDDFLVRNLITQEDHNKTISRINHGLIKIVERLEEKKSGRKRSSTNFILITLATCLIFILAKLNVQEVNVRNPKVKDLPTETSIRDSTNQEDDNRLINDRKAEENFILNGKVLIGNRPQKGIKIFINENTIPLSTDLDGEFITHISKSNRDFRIRFIYENIDSVIIWDRGNKNLFINFPKRCQLIGKIINNEGNPIQGLKVISLLGKSTLTDSLGIFKCEILVNNLDNGYARIYLKSQAKENEKIVQLCDENLLFRLE